MNNQSITRLFGQNLRQLCTSRESPSAVARELGISHVQMHRFLRGESYPKPAQLKQICDYFGTDARIMTEPLDASFQPGAPKTPAHAFGPDELRWRDVLAYALPAQDLLTGAHTLDDGLYALWRSSFARPEKVVRLLLQFSSIDGAKVVRGYDHKSIYDSQPPVALKQREFRGFCIRMNWGYSMQFFASAPSLAASHIYVSPTIWMTNTMRFGGFATISRDEKRGYGRMSRVVMLKVESSCKALIQEAHKPAFYDPKDVPPSIMAELALPMA